MELGGFEALTSWVRSRSKVYESIKAPEHLRIVDALLWPTVPSSNECVTG